MSLSLATLRQYCPKDTETQFLEMVLASYRKLPEEALKEDLDKAAASKVPVMDYWKERVWSFVSRITKKKHYFLAHPDPESFEWFREAVEDAEAEELAEREDEDDDERYNPFMSRRYAPDDLYQ